MKLLFSTAIAVMILASCNEGATNASGQTTDSTADMSSLRSAIDATNEKMSAAFASGDSAAAAALYHRDTKIFPPNMEPVTSPEGLGAMIKGFPQWGITGVQIKSSEVYEGDDVMTEVGTFEFK